MKSTWILIASSSEARLFLANKSYKNLTLLQEFDHPESREKIVDLVSDRPGRYRKSSSTPKSMFEEFTSPKQVEAERFAHILATKLNEGRNQHQYDNLIIIAPAGFRGLLNKFCNSHVKDRIIRELDKNYTKIKQHDLKQYLNGKLSFREAA